MRNDREHFSGGEIDLVELVRGLWGEKFLILFFSMLVTAVAVAGAFLITPLYEARVYVQAPSSNDIAPLNYGRGEDSGLVSFLAKDVYQSYLRSLRSETVRQKFFREVYLPYLSEAARSASRDDLYLDFRRSLQIVQASGDMSSYSYVQVRLPRSDLVVEWAQLFAQMAGEHARRNVIRDARADAVVKARNIEQEIFAKREVARKQREDQLVKLGEALSIAKSVGLKEPPIISEALSAQVSAGMDGALTYMRGTKALEAEIENLRKRSSDDPYVPGLRQLQEALVFYRGLKVDPKTVEVFRQDGAVDSPDSPVGPKKFVVFALGAMLGFALGVFAAIVKLFVFRRNTL